MTSTDSLLPMTFKDYLVLAELFARHMSLRAGFLIAAASAIFHLPFWAACFLIVGNTTFGYFDARLKHGQIDYETDGWEPNPEETEYENKGNLSRVRLTGQEQIVVTRLADLIRGIQ